MKRLCGCLSIAIVFSMTLSVFAVNANTDNTLPSLTLLDGLKQRIQENDPTVETTFTELAQFFTAQPSEFNQADFFNLKSYHYVLKQNYVEGYEALLEARKLANASDNKLALAESFRLEGLILDLSGEHAGALEALNRALALYSEAESDNVLLVYGAMGNVYMSLKDFDAMLALGYQYLSTAKRLDSRREQGIAYFFQGYAQKELGTFQDAKISLLLAEEILHDVEYPFIGIVYSTMAELHIAQQNVSEALKRLNQAAEADRQVGFRYNEGARLLQLAEIYVQRGETELAIAELKAGLTKDVAKNDKVVTLNILEQLVSLSESTKNYQSALDYAKQYQSAYQQSFNEQQSQQLALNRVRLAIAEKEETIKLLEKDNELKEQRNLAQQKNNTMQLYFITGVVVSLVLVIALWLRTRKQRKALDNLAQALQKATDAKSDFLAHMSHEIRTPLNAIIGLTKLSQRSAESQEQQTNLVQIEAASQTLLSVIDEVLDFSKIEAGKLDIESTQFNLDSLVNQAIRFHLARANEKHIELIQHIARDVPHNLIGDPLRIQQILNNLLSNALKFTDDGLISVSVRSKQEDGGIKLIFEVKDTGIGLSTKQKARLFQPFNQGDESISRRYGGTGLGLVICQQLATLMGGNVWVESEVGKGASFYFTIIVKHNPAQQQIVSPSKQLAALNVLVADDVSLSRHAISDALSVANIRADLASGGQEAIAKLRAAAACNSAYDVLILDWKMPDIDGLEVAAIMNQERSAKQPKVIMLSAFDSPKMHEQANLLGIHTFIKKPFGASELVNTIQELCLNVTSSPISATTAAVNIPDFTGKKILLAEDNSLNQKVALGLLADSKATIKVVNNGLEVINTLRDDPSFDIVLMDIQMPEMDGLTASRTIRKELQLNVPIIAMTAHAMKKDIEKSRASGMNGHINKPIDPDKLFAVLANILVKDTSDSTVENTPDFNANLTDAASSNKLAVINKTQAMRGLLNDEALYHVLLNDFVALSSELDALRSAIDNKDYASILRISHIYITALRYIGAYNLAEFTYTVEQIVQHDKQAETDAFDEQIDLLYSTLVMVSAKVKQQVEINREQNV